MICNVWSVTECDCHPVLLHSAYTEKIDQLYDKDQVETKDTLFGEAINAVAAIQQIEPISSDPQTSDLEAGQ